MSHPSTRSRLVTVAALAALAVGVLGGCSSDDDTTSSDASADSSTSTSASSQPSAATVTFDKMIQEELKKVGCYTGEVDGIMGSGTDAAIVAFQTAAGLTADGELGPETDDALKAAVDAGETVCGGSGTTTSTTAGSGTTSTTAAPTTAPCTAAAIQAALPSGETVTSYICSEGYAAGGQTNGTVDGAFVLQAEGTTWAVPGQDPCGSASAGIPPAILEAGCAS